MIAVDNLHRIVARPGGIVEDGVGSGGGAAGRGGHHPAVLDVAAACIGDTGLGERTRDTEVIDRTAEVVEQRAVQAADGMAVAVQSAAEALTVARCERRPSGRTARSGDVGTHDEVEVVAAAHVAVQGSMTTLVVITIAQVDEVPQLRQGVLALCAVVVDVYLTVAHQLRRVVVHIHVVFLVGHHVVQVVIVSHREGYGIRVRLAQIALGIVGDVVLLVVIPVHRCAVVAVLPAVAVVLCVGIVVEDFPAAA